MAERKGGGHQRGQGDRSLLRILPTREHHVVHEGRVRHRLAHSKEEQSEDDLWGAHARLLQQRRGADQHEAEQLQEEPDQDDGARPQPVLARDQSDGRARQRVRGHRDREEGTDRLGGLGNPDTRGVLAERRLEERIVHVRNHPRDGHDHHLRVARQATQRDALGAFLVFAAAVDLMRHEAVEADRGGRDERPQEHKRQREPSHVEE